MPPQDFAELIKIFLNLIKWTLPLMVVLALLSFFLGLVKFIAKAGDEKSHAEGRNLMVWGIIALFIMLSVWGILRLLYSDLGFAKPFGTILLPQ